MGREDEGSAGSFPSLRTEITRACFHTVGKNRIENLGQEGYRSLGKMLQGPVQYTVWARSLSDLETSDDFLNLISGD
jgi:hypothetical protein